MSIQVRCTNSRCGEEFTVSDDKAGQMVKCPGCGTYVLARGEGAQEELRLAEELSFEEEAAEAAPAPSAAPAERPGALVCPSCGATLTGCVDFCPQCGADLRVGAVAAAAAKKVPLKLLLLVGGGVAALVVLIVVIAGGALSGKKEQEPAGPPVAEAPPVPVAPLRPQEPERPKFAVAESELAELKAQKARLAETIQQYRDRLNEVLKHVRAGDANALARQWADLYVFCKDKGLLAEADMCWDRAVRLRPTDPEVNRILGRTAAFLGVPVTPQQGEFLRQLLACVRVTNMNQDFTGHSVRLAGGEQRALPLGASVALEAEPGTVKLEVVDNTSSAVVQELVLPSRHGLTCEAELRKVSCAPPLPFDALSAIYSAVTESATIADVSVQRDAQGRPIQARAGMLTAEGNGEGPLQMRLSRDGSELTIIGRLVMASTEPAGGVHVLYGSAQRLVRLRVDAAARTLSVRDASYYVMRAELSDALWKLLAAAEGDFASEWARRRIAARIQEAESSARRLEAEGRLWGAWEAEAHVYDALAGFWKELEAELKAQDRAATAPAHLDKPRALSLDESAAVYLNWPRFRQAIAAAASWWEPDVLGELARFVRAPARTGYAISPTVDRPAAPAGTGAFDPPAVQLADADRPYVLMAILPLLSDAGAVQQVSAAWPGLNKEARTAAMVSLEQVASPEAIAFLGELSRRPGEAIEVVAGALLSLGVVGTPEAFQYFEQPAVVQELRTANLAARCVAGDPEALAGLQETLRGADASTAANFVGLVSRVETPAALLALSAAIDVCEDAAIRAQIATALAHLGGHVAMSELARLIEKAGQPFPDAIRLVRPDEALMLVEPLGQLAGTAKEPPAEVLKLLAEHGSKAAFAYLKAIAAQGKPQALQAMLERGTAAALEAAADACASATLDVLKAARQRWYSVDRATGEATWTAGVDRAAAQLFLESVLARGTDAKVRLAAAGMLQETGHTPPPGPLLALAREEPPARAAAAEPAAPAAAVPWGTAPARAQAQPFRPEGYQEPDGEPLLPGELTFEAKLPLYALGLLSLNPTQEVSAGLRELADSYTDAQLQSAAMRALGKIGGQANVDYLTRKATERRSSYESPAQLWSELQARMGAAVGLGVAQSTSFLPKLLEMFGELPPEAGSVTGFRGDQADQMGWWQIKLWTACCRALSEMCRTGTPGQLATDSALQEALVQRLVRLIEMPGPDRPNLASVRSTLQAEAVRAFGRAAIPNPSNLLVLSRLALGVGRTTEPARTTTAERDPVQNALVDALTHMAARASDTSSYVSLLRTLVAAPGAGEQWNRLLREMASEPGAAYFRLLTEMFDLTDDSTRRVALQVVRNKGTAGQDCADFIVAAFSGRSVRAEARPAPTVVAAAPTRPAVQPVTPAVTPTTQPGLPPWGAGPPPWVTVEEEGEPEWVKEMRARGELEAEAAPPPPTGFQPPPVAPTAPGPRAPARRVEARVEYSRTGPRRKADWSYSLEQVAARVAAARQKWELVELLFKTQPAFAAAAVGQGGLLDFPQFGPCIAALYADATPQERARIVARLGNLLVAGLTSLDVGGTATQVTLETRRASVAALRRLGDSAAAEALYRGLVGPDLTAAMAAGRLTPGAMPEEMMGPPPPGMPPGYGVGQPTAAMPIASYIARALGSMGREDLLRRALQASGNEFFRNNPVAVQKAALEGMAYLPLERQPVRVLEGLMRAAGTAELQQAVAEALLTALRRQAAGAAST